MKIVDDLSKLGEQRISLTIGNFDGVHKGHQEILSEIKKCCQKSGKLFVVMTFVPHPRQILSPQSNFLINDYTDRQELLAELGVDALMEINFTRDLSTTEAGIFIEKYILNCEKVDDFYIGHDFSFGANKKGNYEFIQKYCASKKIKINKLLEYTSEDSRVSSSQIREYLDCGDILNANKLLGRNFFISGVVIKGEGRGKKLGIPTANLSYQSNRKIPKKGVYISKASFRGEIYHSITNIGNNPTFNKTDSLFLETHIFDFDDDIYGETIKIEILKRVRDERKFPSLEKLVTQIHQDIDHAKRFFHES